MACQVFAGNLDACALRYVLLMTNFVNAVNWAQPEDFSKFASAAYPFLGVCMSNFRPLEILQLHKNCQCKYTYACYV